MTAIHTENSIFKNLLRLFTCFSKRRRIQLGLLFLLQLIGAASEIISIGAILPFLGILTDTEGFMKEPLVMDFSYFIGVTEPTTMIILITGFFATAIVVANILRFFTFYVQSHLSASIGSDVASMLFKNTLLMPYPYFITTNSSEIIGNLTNDLRWLLTVLNNVILLMTQIIIAAAIIISLIIYDPAISCVLALMVFAAYGIVVLIIKKRLHHNSLIISDKYRDYMKSLQEGVGGIRYVALSRFQEAFAQKYKEADIPFRHAHADNIVLSTAPRYFIETIGVIAITGLAIYFTVQGRPTSEIVSTLGFIALAAHRLLPVIQLIYNALTTIMGMRVSLDRTVKFLHYEDTAPVSKTVNKLELERVLEFKNIWFDYAGDINKSPDDWTIKDVSLSIKARGTVAFVGHTGSGKSTIMDLILGLLTPQRGEITIDGCKLDAENIAEWQAAIAHVPQHIFLTDSSIAENIAFGIRPDKIDLERVISAAKLAQIHDFIESLDHQYNQTVGERGVRLSGGQLQRIGIARALYNRPSVVIFDEATSALDSLTESDVMKAIESLGKEITVVLIAHRLSTVKNADNIFVLEKGRLVDQGTYQTLIERSTYFKTLTSGQT